MKPETIHKKALKLTNKIDDLPKKMDKAEAQARYTEELEEIRQKREQEWKEEIEEGFSELQNKLEKEKERAREKINEVNSGSYEKRSYHYQKASRELDKYDDPVEFVKRKSELASDDIEFQEASKAALEAARAAGENGKVEDIKDRIAQNMGEEEKKWRKRLAKSEILSENLSAAKQSILMDSDKIKQGETATAKQVVTGYLDPKDLKKAENKVAETIE